MRHIRFAGTGLMIVVCVTTFCGITACKKDSSPKPAGSTVEFESNLDKLRKKSNIPGMAAGIVKDGKVVWLKSFGYENLAQQKLVSNTTIFHLASLTKTFASTILLQLHKEKKIDLNDPVSNYGINLPEQGTVRVIHLLSHTSEGVPGTNYRYDGDRFALLSKVIQVATGKDFHELVNERIAKVLSLQNTAASDMRFAYADGLDTLKLKQNIAQGYASNSTQTVVYPKQFSTAAGLMSNIDDMLKYAAGYDGSLLLSADLKSMAFTPMLSPDGKKSFPYGLGWFVQKKEGINITWHYGYWTGMSSLIIRIPERNLSFVLLANSDMLSAPYPLAAGDIWVSPYAKEFLTSFVLAGAKL